MRQTDGEVNFQAAVMMPALNRDVHRGFTVWCPGFSLPRHPEAWTRNALSYLRYRRAKASGAGQSYARAPVIRLLD